jgi:hypothetical protein
MRDIFAKAFILFLLSISFRSKAEESLNKDLNYFTATISSGAESARDWLARALGYGQAVLSKTQSVEMLPYRYALFLSFFGGVAGALCTYYLLAASRRVARYEFGTHDAATRPTFLRPKTFRSMLHDAHDYEDLDE